MTEKQ